MFDDHEVGNTDLIKEDEYLFDGLALNNPDDIDNAVDIILEAIENRSTDVVDKKWIPNEGKSHWYNIGTLEANADIVYATYALYLEQGGEEIPQVSDKLSAIDKKLHMNMNCFETAFVYAEDGSEAVAVLLTYTGAGGMSHTVPTLISVSVYGVPKRNADRPARGNYAAAGGNINRRKWEFMMRRQAVDRGWPRWYHESAFTHVQDRATLESDLSGI